jgi:hypothetical protein
LAKVAALAHRLKLSKRSRLAHKARLARDAEAAHEAKMAKVAASAHKAKLAKNAQLANKVILAASAPLGPQMILGKDTRFAPKEALAKGPGKTQETSAKNAFTGEAALVQEKPSANEGIGAVGAEYSHPDGLAKDAGPMREGFLAKDTGLTPKLILTEAVGLAAKGILAKDSPSAREGPLVGSAGLAGDEILVQGAGLTEVVKVSIKLGATFEEIIVSVARMGNFPAKKAYLFLEDSQVPLNPKRRLDSKHPRHLVHHVHTQKEIMVMVQFNGRESIKRFSPATTVRKVLAWASHEFKMPDHDGTEVFLTVPGSIVPLPDAVHIGRYVPHDQNKLALNVMTPARV